MLYQWDCLRGFNVVIEGGSFSAIQWSSGKAKMSTVSSRLDERNSANFKSAKV